MTQTELLDPIGERLHAILPLLACPTCRGQLRLAQSKLECAGCARRFPIRKGVPILLPEEMHEPGAGSVSAEDPVSKHPYSPSALDIISRSAGWVLDLGAGGKLSRFEKVVQVDIFRYPMTDVVGTADCLPFRDNAFEAVISQAVFEHLQYPDWAAAEVRRVLQPGGIAKIDTAFLQPEHGYPFHFYNASETGLRHWFREFDIEWSGVEPYQHPKWALSWFLGVYLDRIGPEPSDLLRRTPVGELVAALDRSGRGCGTPADAEILNALDQLPSHAQRILAAGVSVHVVNRSKSGPVESGRGESGRSSQDGRDREETRKLIAIREEIEHLLLAQESARERNILAQDRTRYLVQFYPGRNTLAYLGAKAWLQYRLVALLRLVLPRPIWFYARRAVQKRRGLLGARVAHKSAPRPFLSVVVEPDDPVALTNVFFSLVHQTYSGWELLVVECAHQTPALRRAVADFGMLDERVRIVPEGASPVSTYCQALAQASGEFCVRIPDGAYLAFDAVRHCVTLARSRPDTACILADHECGDEESLDRMRCVVSPSFAERMNAMPPWFALVSAGAVAGSFAQSEELVLAEGNIGYIPKVLFRVSRKKSGGVP